VLLLSLDSIFSTTKQRVLKNIIAFAPGATQFYGIFGADRLKRKTKYPMRKSDLINQISEKTGIPKVDVLVTLETMFKEVKESLAQGENIYIRGFGSFITKKRAAKIGRNIKRNVAVEIPEHYIPAFKPAKEFVSEVKTKRKEE
jgi:DNA-binding protein HU-beta